MKEWQKGLVFLLLMLAVATTYTVLGIRKDRKKAEFKANLKVLEENNPALYRAIMNEFDRSCNARERKLRMAAEELAAAKSRWEMLTQSAGHQHEKDVELLNQRVKQYAQRFKKVMDDLERDQPTHEETEQRKRELLGR